MGPGLETCRLITAGLALALVSERPTGRVGAGTRRPWSVDLQTGMCQSPNQRVRRLAPNLCLSARQAADGS